MKETLKSKDERIAELQTLFDRSQERNCAMTNLNRDINHAWRNQLRDLNNSWSSSTTIGGIIMFLLGIALGALGSLGAMTS